MNLILDTNAFIYLYNILTDENQCIDKWNNKKFQKEKYQKYCLSFNKIIITGETLYELFLQSLRIDNTMNQFIEYYLFIQDINKNNPGKIVFTNSKTGMYFDTTYFAKCVNNYLAFDHTISILKLKFVKKKE